MSDEKLSRIQRFQSVVMKLWAFTKAKMTPARLIFLMVVTGLGIIAFGFFLYEQNCRGGLIDVGWCRTINSTPPWSLLAALATAPALILTWYWKDKHKRQDIEDKKKDIEIARDGQVTERFTRAIEHLGSDKLAVRLGAIYALERIAWDSPRDHWAIVETLSAFVRMSVPCTEFYPDWKVENRARIIKTPFDVQAALTVLGRRDSSIDPEGCVLNLSSADLSFANLEEANLKGANFICTTLRGTFFSRAHLEGAIFVPSFFSSTIFQQAHLEGAHFEQTELNGVFFYGADIQDAHFGGTDLSGAHGLTREGLAKAFIDHRTKLPSKFADMIPPAPEEETSEA